MIYLIRHATPLIDYKPCNAHSAKLLLDEYNQTSSIDEGEIAAFLSQPDLSQVLWRPKPTSFPRPSTEPTRRHAGYSKPHVSNRMLDYVNTTCG